MQGLEIEAVYEHGTLKLARALPLAEGQKVTITIHPPGSAVHRFCGAIPWKRDPEELHRYLNDLDEGLWGDRGLR
jgi:predicted DNA-binding antitoxin AbrB/MazE fold protein